VKDWSKLKVEELRSELSGRGLPTNGRKVDLVARLKAEESGETGETGPSKGKEETSSKKRKTPASKNSKASNKKAKAADASEVAAPGPDVEREWAPPVTDDNSNFMKLISWNLNGLNAVHKKGHLTKYVKEEKPDVICFQETKTQNSTIIHKMLGDEYPYEYWSNSVAKLGYAGTATFSKIRPLSVSYGLDIDKHDQEGRVITTEFDNFYLVNTYIPNAGQKLERLTYREEWNQDFLSYLKKLEQTKPVVWCGDLNVAHQDIDIANPKSNKKSAGFTKEERRDFGQVLDSGFVDTFRHQNPDVKQFTWWSARFNCRAKNIGWRLDYFVVSKDFLPLCGKAFVRPNVPGSDHCPIGLLVKQN